jgi:predicted NBD/HSP70 family sugar kinase
MSIIVGVIPSTASELRQAGLVRALQAVHDGRDLTRAQLARELGCTRATAAAIVSDLERLGLVSETAAAPTGKRGRPSLRLLPAPRGPVILALEIAVDAVRSAIVGLGGELARVEAAPLDDGSVSHVMAVAGTVLRRRLRGLGERCAGVGIAMYGLVDRTNGIVTSAPGLGWEDIDIVPLLGLPGGVTVGIDNVATLSALADARRGCGRGLATVLYLHAAVGLGGALVVEGRPLHGRTGFAGEYGHLPFGQFDLACRCGSRGCWETEVDQPALAHAAGRAVRPGSAAHVVKEILAEAARGDAVAARAVHEASAALGRGIGALVNVHDPDLVVLAGHAADLHAIARSAVEDAAGAAAMSAHRARLPPINATTYGIDGGLVGAAELLFDQLLHDPAGLSAHAGDRR